MLYKNKKAARILTIDPGTRYMGIAVLEGDELICHGVETIRDHRSPHERLRECRRRVLRLLDDFKPNLLVVEKTFFARNRNVALLNVLVDEIRALARRRRLPLLSFAPATVKKVICGNGRASKEEVARAVVARYPELKVYLTQDRKWKERYHANRFDAVALAMMRSQWHRPAALRRKPRA